MGFLYTLDQHQDMHQTKYYDTMLLDSKYSHGLIINAIYGKKGLSSVPGTQSCRLCVSEFNMKPKCRHNSDGILSSLSLPASSFGTANLRCPAKLFLLLCFDCRHHPRDGRGQTRWVWSITRMRDPAIHYEIRLCI